MLLSDVCLSVCLSVAYIGPKSRTESSGKTTIGAEVAHVTRDSNTTFKVKRSKGQLVADVLNSQHAWTGATWRISTKILLCRNSNANLQINAKILSTCRGGGILCRHAHSLLYNAITFSYWTKVYNIKLGGSQVPELENMNIYIFGTRTRLRSRLLSTMKTKFELSCPRP